MNFELCAQGIHHVVIEVLDIISYDGLGKAISLDDVRMKLVTYAFVRFVNEAASSHLVK